MANTKISALTSLGATPAPGDWFSIVDVSDTTQAASGSTKKIAAAYIALTDGATTTFSGGGAISLGGFTLTVPANGTAALRGVANTFTNTQTVTPSATNLNGLVLNMPTSTSASMVLCQYNSVERAKLSIISNDTILYLEPWDNGSSTGARFALGRNSNASTPAPGFVWLMSSNGTFYPLWSDNSGNIRTDTSGNVQPVNATTGTVVGTQSSSLDSKIISDTLPDIQEAYQHILQAARTGLRAWSYKNNAYNGEFFPNGIVTDYAPRYGMDRDEEHPYGKSLNPPVAIGDLMASILVISERLDKLEALSQLPKPEGVGLARSFIETARA